MKSTELLLNCNSIVLRDPIEHFSKWFFGDVLVAVLDELRTDEQLGAAIDVSESFAAPVDDEPKQSALSFHVSWRKLKEVLNLPLKERLEGIVRPADDPKQFNGSCSSGLDFSIPEIVVDEDIYFLLEESTRSVVDCDVR